MPAHFDVISVGEAKIDAFMTLSDSNNSAHLIGSEICFRYGGKVPVEEYDLQMGGNAANMNVGLSRLGLRTTLFAEIGDDALSLQIHNSLAKENIDRSHINYDKNTASSLSMIINFKGDRTIFSQHVERKHNFVFEDLSAEYIFLTSMGNDWHLPYKRALKFAKDENIKIAFNPGNLQFSDKELLLEVVKNTDILFLNKEEAERILYGKDLRNEANEMEYMKFLAIGLAEIGVKIVVITNGRHGSYALSREGKLFHQGLYAGKRVERTGAGDGYAAGFLAAIIQNESVEEAMKWGSMNSTSVVGKIGAEAGLLTKNEMKERLSKV